MYPRVFNPFGKCNTGLYPVSGLKGWGTLKALDDRWN